MKKSNYYMRNTKFYLLIIIAVLFMSIGYASINSVSLGIDGDVIAYVQDGVFITDVEYVPNEENVNTDYSISRFYSTILNSNVVLEEGNIDSELSLKVSFYNNSEDDYIFTGVIFADELIGEIDNVYSNLDITYTYDNQREIISKNGGTLDVTITFKYSQIIESTSNILNSILNFKFEKVKYVNVSFDGNGGTVDLSSKEVIYNGTYGELPIPIREGYTFSGWAALKNGKEIITEDNVVNIDSDHTLYAQWNAKSYTIRFNSNGGSGSMINQTILYDAVVPLSKNTFTKAGYKFLGWATSEDGEKAYNDMDSVVNLKLDGIVDLYALWVEDSYTVTFDYNGGVGSVSSMQVLYGSTYGTLPEYPHLENHIFKGWYTESEGGIQVFSTSIVDIEENHTLYAHWEASPYNDAIQNIVIKNVPDQNSDGVIDSIYLSFTCSSSFEKYNIPLNNLIVGQKYRLRYTASNNASFGDIESGYKNSIYGSKITKDAELSAGSIKTEVIADGGLIAEWSDRSKGDTWLNGPFDKEMIFTAEASNMYWTWDFGLIEDDILYDFNITNIVLEPVVPVIDFANKKMILHTSSTATVKNDVSTAYESDFIFHGAGYAETLYFPITGLTSGSTYTITFEHLYTGTLIDDSANTTNLRYEYGSGIMNSAPTTYGSYLTSIGTWASNTFVMKTVTGNKETITFTFTASSETAYWVWNMANCKDFVDNQISIKVTNFAVTHASGGKMNYYNSSN